ncbi:hypothetical protein [uncultured Tateyamaria sp.]|uniref:hypothetical protein n=1 Tax=uncultured Tateyamaria sp. TaxID=455651 RepID=UPI002601974E|nr:hypothetical protein [uncultured Tateyamaria sp.]
MTNTDVEDVLASIRRLVSDNTRPGSTPVQQPPSDRLVLTPSLRVPEDDPANAPEEAEAEMADVEDEADAEEETLSQFAQSAFSKEPADEAGKIDVRVQGYTPADDSDLIASLSSEGFSKPLDPPVQADAHADAESVVEDLSDEHADVPDDTGNDDVDAALVATALTEAGLLETVNAEENVQDAEVPEDWAEEVEDAAAAPDEDEDEGSTAEAETPDPMPRSLSEKIEALETLVGERRDQFEPDDPGVDAYAGTEPPAMEWEDADVEEDDVAENETAEADAAFEVTEVEEVAPEVEAVETETSEPEVAEVEAVEVEEVVEDQSATEAPRVDETAAVASALFASDDDVLDEDALRELISDIVREELQGALGERITRNVRKLVRREIHRALAAQDLE